MSFLPTPQETLRNAGLSDAEIALGYEPGDLSDAEVKDLAQRAGLKWLEADGEEGGYPGGFDMSDLAAVRALIWNARAATSLTDDQRVAFIRQAGHTIPAGMLNGNELTQYAKNLALLIERASATPTWPGELTSSLADILGTMCFSCIHIAAVLRIGGQEIKTRAEDEQAAALHWMLGFYARHGDGWRQAALADLDRRQLLARATADKAGGAA